MEITWLGHANFRIRGREGVVVTDPAPWKGAPAKATADIVTVSHTHPGHNQAALVPGSPRVIEGPGEYEVKGIQIYGIQTFHDAEKGKKRGKNTAYVLDFDELVVCHLGDLGHLLGSDQVDQMRNVDVLLVPVGGSTSLDGAGAAEVVRQVEPRYVVPMHFAHPSIRKELGPVERFLKEMGVQEAEPQAKLALQASSGDAETKVVVLDPRV
jgi:L-ascorbate metabolism protein UlaG (beta-lactamase superfamily)